MSNILIINLKRFGDIYTTAHLVNSISRENPHANISLLVYEEFNRAAVNLKSLKKVYTLDRKKILAYKQNDLFSDGFALDSFFGQIEEVSEKKWDKVINYSNESVGAYLSSYLTIESETQPSGVYYSENNIAHTATDWDIIFNDVLTSYKHTPIHFVDCYHQMAGTTYSRIGEKVSTSTKHNESAFKNINFLRQSRGKTDSPVKIIAIQLQTSAKEKNISFEVLKELIQLYIDDKNYYPILLIAPIDDERTFATRLNNEFDNALVLVEADLQALTSVLFNVDILITPDTVTKHIADLAETPTVEVALGFAPFLKQGTYNSESLILTPIITDRSFSEKEVSATNDYIKVNNKIKAKDIYYATGCLAVSAAQSTIPLSEGVTLYRPTQDNLGIRYTAIAGDHDTNTEVSRLMSRYFLAKLFGLKRDISILGEVLTFDNREIQNWLNQEKDEITLITKDLLGTLRSLLQTQENNKKGVDFMRSLEKLLVFCRTDHLVAIPTLVFRSKIEALDNTQSLAENIREIEALLYELKGNIQKTFQCLKELEQGITETVDTSGRVSSNRAHASV